MEVITEGLGVPSVVRLDCGELYKYISIGRALILG